MKHRIMTALITAKNLVDVRDRTRAVGGLFGLDKLDCTRFITAVSEISRNVVQHGGEGAVTFLVDLGDAPSSAQHVVAEITDQEAVAPGRAAMPAGHIGAKRLADRFSVERPAGGGTVVAIGMARARGAPPLAPAEIAPLVEQLTRQKPRSALEEHEQQTREMMLALQALRDRQSELELADERKNQFVATLAHELRNPLGTLQMMLHILRHKPEFQAPALVSHLAVIARQAQQMNQLVTDLMDVSRVSQGKVELNKQPIDMNELVSQALEMTGAAITAKDHHVDIALHFEPLWVDADSTRLKQVLSNVLHNAARYSDQHGHISVRVKRAQSQAVVEVEDRGTGIAPNLLPHVFGLFVQGTPASDGQPTGLGVGLSLAQRLVHEHGGTISAASEGIGRGSRFTVTLPLCPPRAGGPGGRSAEERPGAA
jgi:signal transduction histidine kinase